MLNLRLLRRRLKLLLSIIITALVISKVVPSPGSIWMDSKFLKSWNCSVIQGWNDTDFPSLSDPDVNKTEIIILRWTGYFGSYYDATVLTGGACPYLRASTTLTPAGAGSGVVFDIPCRISFDRRYLKASDALVFHSPDLAREKLPPQQQRSKDQLWIYMQQEESPALTSLNLRHYSNVFNWTMTYRRDSDVYHPFGHIIPVVDSTAKKNSDSSTCTNLACNNINRKLSKRPNLVAWLVSTCESNSNREYFVTELQNYIPVGIYGKCGKPCPPAPPSPEDEGGCRAYLAKTYKFYLAWESSLCSDYITEKFFDALRDGLVPVVYGGEDPTDYSAIAPQGSYIDARNFGTERELADYLIHLDRNDEEYLKYFEWKAKFQVIKGQGWCNLCQKVFEHLQAAPKYTSSSLSSSEPQERKGTYKWYKDLWTWWHHINFTDESRLGDAPPRLLSSRRESAQYKRKACNVPL